MSPKATAEGDESLKRLGGGRWQTRDERFTIEPQSGTWAVLDAQDTDDFGLPLVRGPFRSLTEAKAAITDARTSAAPTSPLASRARAPGKDAKPAERAGKDRKAAPARSAAGPAEEPAEPGWFRDLSPADRGRARRLIERLTEAGASDAASIVRRDLAGGVPAIAAHAIEQRLADLPGDASKARVARLLADGADDGLGIRWRLVDGSGRPIVLDLPAERRSGR